MINKNNMMGNMMPNVQNFNNFNNNGNNVPNDTTDTTAINRNTKDLMEFIAK